MKRISSALTILLIASAAATHVEAKRGAPKEVPLITRDGITYSVPHDQMGFVIAKDEKTGRLIWSKQIYVVKYDPLLEQDVQDCFITELRFEGGKLVISNEHDGQFELDPATLAIKVLKGAEVIDRTAPEKK
jgi:hypothetical protein